MEEIAYSINRTAKALGVGRSTIYKLIKTGQVDALKIGTRTLITTGPAPLMNAASSQATENRAAVFISMIR